MPPLFALTELLAITVTTLRPPKKPLIILARPKARRSLLTFDRLFLRSNLSTALMLNKDSITAISVIETTTPRKSRSNNFSKLGRGRAEIIFSGILINNSGGIGTTSFSTS